MVQAGVGRAHTQTPHQAVATDMCLTELLILVQSLSWDRTHFHSG